MKAVCALLCLALARGAAGVLPQRMTIDATVSKLSCTGYGGNSQACGDAYRDRAEYVQVILGSCKDSCAGVDGTCHAGTTTLTPFIGGCTTGGDIGILWKNVSQTSNCKDKVDFFYQISLTGCASHVKVWNQENDVLLEYDDYAASSKLTDVLFDISCPGIEAAKLRESVKCGAYAGHNNGGDFLLTFWNTNKDRRLTFLPGIGNATGAMWSPTANPFIMNFTYTLPAEYTNTLGFTYQLDRKIKGAWEPASPIYVKLNEGIPEPPTLMPTSDTIYGCAATATVDITEWICTVNMRDAMGPVAQDAKLWSLFELEYNTNGCLLTDIQLMNDTLTNASTYTFKITREASCFYWSLDLTLNMTIGGEPIGHYDDDGSVVHSELVLSASPALTPTPTFPKKDEKSHTTLYIIFAALFGALVCIGLSFVAYKRYQAKQQNVGTWVVLGEGENKNRGGSVVPIMDEEGPSSQMKDIGSSAADYHQADDDVHFAE